MNRTELLKKMLPGLLPLLIFIIADEIWGTKIGMMVAVAFGIVELIVIYVKEKRIDRFVIADTGLLIGLGLISILLDNDIFFKLKPALIEMIFCVVLGISAFSGNNLVMQMTRRYMRGMEFNPLQEISFQRSVKIMFWIFSFHTLLILYAAWFLSNEAWAFISGVLFYIVFGVYFVFEMIYTKRQNKKYQNEEWLPLVDEEGKVLGKAPRSLCHKNKKLMHPVVHVHIFNKKNEVFLQKRPDNKLVQPGKWDTAVGGHIAFGEKLEDSLRREIMEETGLQNLTCKLHSVYKWESNIETELVYLFVAQYNQPLHFKNDEIADSRFWTRNEINENLGKDIFTPNFEKEFNELFAKSN